MSGTDRTFPRSASLVKMTGAYGEVHAVLVTGDNASDEFGALVKLLIAVVYWTAIQGVGGVVGRNGRS